MYEGMTLITTLSQYMEPNSANLVFSQDEPLPEPREPNRISPGGSRVDRVRLILLYIFIPDILALGRLISNF
jgi:hypothetical protein